MNRAQVRALAGVEAIKAVYQPGMCLREIAEALGQSRSAVSGMFHRYPEQLKCCPLGKQGRAKGEIRPRRNGLTYARKWTPDRIEKVAALMKQGLSATEIGKRMDASRNAIIGIIDRTPELCSIGLRGGNGRPRMTKVERKERALATSRRYRERRAAEAKPKPFKPVVVFNNVNLMVQDFIAKNGVRKFEAGASADYYILSNYLQERGWKLTTLQGARYGLGRMGARLRSVSWKEAIAVVDKLRRAEGLEPFMAA